MIAQAFVAGGATLVVGLAVFRLWLKTPPRTVCPCCGEPTAPMTHPLLALAARWVLLRWCAACGWQGWGRNGPVLSRRSGPVSDGSGFRWGPERLAADFGFRWADPFAATMEVGSVPGGRTSAPAHPSGFRWAGGSDSDEAACVEASPQTSGFRFREPTEPEVAAAAHPSGFRWAVAPSEPDRGSDAVERPRASDRPNGMFRWAAAPSADFRWSGRRPAARAPSTPPLFRWKD